MSPSAQSPHPRRLPRLPWTPPLNKLTQRTSFAGDRGMRLRCSRRPAASKRGREPRHCLEVVARRWETIRYCVEAPKEIAHVAPRT